MCRSKAGLTVHQKWKHRVAEERMRFPCVRCERVLDTEGARVNHERMCMGDRLREDGRVECGRCGRAITRANISRHRRGCRGVEEEGQDRGDRIGRAGEVEAEEEEE